MAEVTQLLLAATVTDYAMIGGGNARLLDPLPAHCRLGANVNAFRGGFRLWQSSRTWR